MDVETGVIRNCRLQQQHVVQPCVSNKLIVWSNFLSGGEIKMEAKDMFMFRPKSVFKCHLSMFVICSQDKLKELHILYNANSYDTYTDTNIM